MREITYAAAIAEATALEMDRDKNVFVFGLDVDDHKSIQGSTAGILERFGSERIFGTPLSEDAMTGIAVGAAMNGMRPIHVHIRMDFTTLAMNQIINMAAKMRYTTGGAISVPLVVRAMIGRSWGQGAQHSQALHSLFAHIPGLRVVMPSNPHDAKACLATSIRENNPVIFIEHRLLYSQTGFVREGEILSKLGGGRVTKEGKDITIVATSHMVLESLRAANILSAYGISVEVIDPIWIKPLDIAMIIKSVEKTKNLLVVDNGWLTCGFSSEVIAQVFENTNEKFCAARIGFAESTCPTTRELENYFYPNPMTIVESVVKLLKRKININFDDSALFSKEANEFKGPF